MFSRKLPTQFPDITGTGLDGAKMRLPGDFETPWNLLILAFTDEQDPLSDQWAGMAQRIAEHAEGTLSVYELPLVGKGFKVFQGLIRQTMKARADATGEVERTVPLYVDKKGFAKSLKLKDMKTVHVLVVDDTGHIAWRGQGDVTPAKLAEIEEIIGETVSRAPATSAPPRQTGERSREAAE